MLDLAKLDRCFQGAAPAYIVTCAVDGTPNVTVLSQVLYMDERHVALSRQFFNKTLHNVLENPQACVYVNDPATVECYELELRYERSEAEGPLFEAMAVRIDAIASHTGMTGVFKLAAADVYEVLAIRSMPEFLVGAATDPAGRLDADPARGSRKARALSVISQRIAGAEDLDELLSTLLASLRDELEFQHAMVLLPDEESQKLYTVASMGYGAGDTGVGAEVAMGEGVIGAAARSKRTLRIADVEVELRYGRTVRRVVSNAEQASALTAEIPLPGLPNARSELAIPLVSKGRLVGVLALESESVLGFDEMDEALVDVLGRQLASALERAASQPDDVERVPRTRVFRLFRHDDCVFVDGEYLIRNVPGKILWKILRGYADHRRTEFSNRELRLDPALKLPPIKDNLESRLILLRKRLEQKCPDVRMVRTARGRFRLDVDCAIRLTEQDSA